MSRATTKAARAAHHQHLLNKVASSEKRAEKVIRQVEEQLRRRMAQMEVENANLREALEKKTKELSELQEKLREKLNVIRAFGQKIETAGQVLASKEEQAVADPKQEEVITEDQAIGCNENRGGGTSEEITEKLNEGGGDNDDQTPGGNAI